MRLRSVLIAPILTLALAGCGSTASTTDTSAALCTEMAQMQTALTTLKDTTKTTTVDAFKQASAQVKTEFDQVKTAAGTNYAAELAELNTAYNTLAQGINSIPADATLAEAQLSLKEEMAAVDAARLKLNASAKCPTS
jgi:hypothetical protein